MKFRLLLLTAFSLFATARLQAQTEEELIVNHVQMMGGEHNWKAVNSISIEKTIDTENEQLLVKTHIQKGKNYRADYIINSRDTSLKNKKFFVVVTPEKGWQQMPETFGKLEPLSEDRAVSVKIELDYEDPFVNYKEKGVEIVFVDLVNQYDRELFQFFIKYPNGLQYMCLMDTKTYEIFKMTRTNSDIIDEKTFTNYKKLPEGIIIPHTITATDGTHNITKVKVNPVLKESLFKVDLPKPTTTIKSK